MQFPAKKVHRLYALTQIKPTAYYKTDWNTHKRKTKPCFLSLKALLYSNVCFAQVVDLSCIMRSVHRVCFFSFSLSLFVLFLRFRLASMKGIFSTFCLRFSFFICSRASCITIIISVISRSILEGKSVWFYCDRPVLFYVFNGAYIVSLSQLSFSFTTKATTC